jgi:predicted DNA-binding protein
LPSAFELVILSLVPNTTDPISLRLPSELHLRLQNAADRIDLAKHTLCQQAIKAAIYAIEEANGHLVLPVEFTVKSRPVRRKSAINPRKSVQIPPRER